MTKWIQSNFIIVSEPNQVLPFVCLPFVQILILNDEFFCALFHFFNNFFCVILVLILQMQQTAILKIAKKTHR